MWIRVLLITLLITSLVFVQAKRKQSQTKQTQKHKIHAKKLPTKTITKQKSPQLELKNQKSLWLLSVVWPAGYCHKKQCSKTYLDNWDHQSFLINGLSELNKVVRKQAKKLELNLTIFKTQDLSAIRQDLKNYFPPNLQQTKSKKFFPKAWIQQWEENGQGFDIKNPSLYFKELVSIYKSLKGLQKIANVTKNEVKSKKDLAKLLGLEQNSFSVECQKVNKNTFISQLQICINLKNKQFTLTKCNSKLLKKQCSYPLILNGLNQKWTRQQKWKNQSLVINYLVDSQYDIPSPFKNIFEKPVEKQVKKVQNQSNASNNTVDNIKQYEKEVKLQKKKKQQSINPSLSKCEGNQNKKCRKTAFKSKQIQGKIQLSWLLGQCYETSLRNQKNHCQWDQIIFWDQQSFVVEGLQTYPNTNIFKKQIKELKKAMLQNKLNIKNLFNQTEQASLKQIWPQNIIENENSWQLAWKDNKNGINFLITLKEILPHLFSLNNKTDFTQFQREYFEITKEYYYSLKKLQKVPKSSYTLQQLAKLLGLSIKNINIQCANTNNQKTNFLTSLDICVKLFSKDNQTISIKTSECKSKQKYQGCSFKKNKKVKLLFWRNKSSQAAPYWGHKYIKVILPISKFVKSEESQLANKQNKINQSQLLQTAQIQTQTKEIKEYQENQQQKEQQSIKENSAQSDQTPDKLTEPIIKQNQKISINEVKEDQKDDQNQETFQKNERESIKQVQQVKQQTKSEEDNSVEQTEQIKQPANSESNLQASMQQQLSQIQL